jgi:hypothetical protein
MRSLMSTAVICLVSLSAPLARGGDCPSQTLVVDSVVPGGEALVCPCFAVGEIAMTIHEVPRAPGGGDVTLASVQIQWANLFGLPGTSTQGAIIIYDLNQTGPVDPSTLTPIVEFPDPQLSAGFLNQFDFAGRPIVLPKSRFGIGLEYSTSTAGCFFCSSIVNDTDGHADAPDTIRNWVFTAGDWETAASLGVDGDWVIRAIVEVCEEAPPDPDLDGDDDVDGFDLALLLGAWGGCPAKGACPADFDGNGMVNGFDLAILLAAWG